VHATEESNAVLLKQLTHQGRSKHEKKRGPRRWGEGYKFSGHEKGQAGGAKKKKRFTKQLGTEVGGKKNPPGWGET